MIKTSIDIKKSKFLNSFSHIIKDELLDKKNKINLFVLNSDANEFDYSNFKNNTKNHIVNFALPRKYVEENKDDHWTLVEEAKSKFVQKQNMGEIGELLLFCFLEIHLGAPKILSKLELKTSSNLYVNGSDGVHLLQLENGDYQMIYGESKIKADVTAAITKSFESISQFKNEINDKGGFKSGKSFEESIINGNLQKEFAEDEVSFIKNLIYPTESTGDKPNLDTAFGIFIGYEIKITKDDKKLSNSDFRLKINDQIEKEVRSKFTHIQKKVKKYGLLGHNFYIYILPFSNLEKNRKMDTHFNL